MRKVWVKAALGCKNFHGLLFFRQDNTQFIRHLQSPQENPPNLSGFSAGKRGVSL